MGCIDLCKSRRRFFEGNRRIEMKNDRFDGFIRFSNWQIYFEIIILFIYRKFGQEENTLQKKRDSAFKELEYLTLLTYSFHMRNCLQKYKYKNIHNSIHLYTLSHPKINK